MKVHAMFAIHTPLVLLLILMFSACIMAQACRQGDVRLSDGRNNREGRVEFCLRNQWGTVCNDGFSSTEASVVCGQLGLTTSGATVLPQSLTTAGSGPIWLDDVDCSGIESQLGGCSTRPFGLHDCTHAEDVGIRCVSRSRRTTMFNIDGNTFSVGQIIGIVIGTILGVLIIASVIAVICYKMKGHCQQNVQYSDTVTFVTARPHLTNTSSNSVGHYIPPSHNPASSAINGTRTTTHIEEPSHSEATTYTGEAPPAYHAAEQYRTVTPESYKNHTLSVINNDSTHNDNPSAPPAYIDT